MRRPFAVSLVVALAIGGCYRSHTRTSAERDAGSGERLDATIAPAPDAGPNAVDLDAALPIAREAGPPSPAPCDRMLPVDLLLVLDDSGSIRTREAQLQDRLGRMLQQLVRPLDLNADGTEDWPRVRDMHLGIVSTSARGPTFCEDAADGRLLHRPASTEEGCLESYPRFLEYVDGEVEPSELVRDMTCVGFAARDGCMIEQPLEAVAKALLPRGAPFTFVAGQAHGDTHNAGFLRPDSVLAILIVSDEDDCSVVDPSVIELSGEGEGGDTGRFGPAGCQSAEPGQLYPIERYASVLRWLRPHHPERIVVGMIVGIEAGLIVTDPLPEPPAACAGPVVYPARLYELARGLPAHSVVSSVCDLGAMETVQAVAARIAGASCAD